MMHSHITELVNKVNSEIEELCLPPAEGALAKTNYVLAKSLVAGTRGYIEKVVNQINGCYEQGWYDACAVMIRRLLETLIIEAFEYGKIAHKIKNPKTGDFYYLKDLISLTINEPSWNLGRDAEKALPLLKDIGDKSAHSRRFNAHRTDIEKLIPKVRIVVQELTYLAGLK